MPLNELEEKTQRITALLDREDLGGVLLNAQHTFAWLTAGGNNAVDTSRENGVASLLVTRDGKRFILANNIETPRMLAEEVSADDFEPVGFSWQGEKAAPLAIEKAKALIEKGSRLATDILMDGSTTAIEGKVAACRYHLTDAETERLRKLGKDAGAAMLRTIDKIAPGQTEIEIAETLRHQLSVGGMTSVVTLVAADERIANFRHPVPSLNSWHKTLLLVTCSKRDGLIVSHSRLICVGRVPDDLKARTEAAAFVNAALLDATRPGASGTELYNVAVRAYAACGFAADIDRHHQGGAVGYKTREWVAHPQSGEIVQPRQAFAWNPSITGTKVEETCIATAGGIEIITATPGFPQIAVTVGGTEYLSPGILSI